MKKKNFSFNIKTTALRTKFHQNVCSKYENRYFGKTKKGLMKYSNIIGFRAKSIDFIGKMNEIELENFAWALIKNEWTMFDDYYYCNKWSDIGMFLIWIVCSSSFSLELEINWNIAFDRDIKYTHLVSNSRRFVSISPSVSLSLSLFRARFVHYYCFNNIDIYHYHYPINNFI